MIQPPAASREPRICGTPAFADATVYSLPLVGRVREGGVPLQPGLKVREILAVDFWLKRLMGALTVPTPSLTLPTRGREYRIAAMGFAWRG